MLFRSVAVGDGVGGVGLVGSAVGTPLVGSAVGIEVGIFELIGLEVGTVVGLAEHAGSGSGQLNTCPTVTPKPALRHLNE